MRLKALGVEVHARSLFLQACLFMEELPPKLRHAAPHLARVRNSLKDASLTPLAAALGFVLAQPEIASGLVGVTSTRELDEIMRRQSSPCPTRLGVVRAERRIGAYAVALVSAATTRRTSLAVIAGNMGKVRIWR